MSVRVKLFIALFFLSLFPYVIISFFVFKNEETILRENIKNQQIQNLDLVKRNIEDYFLSLKRNLRFWSKAQILDDLLTDDIDKRIQIFLDQIKINYKLRGNIYVLNLSKTVIASTDTKSLRKKLHIKDSDIVISFPVFASFNKKKIGNIVYVQPSEKLKDFLYSNNLVSLSVINRYNNIIIGYSNSIPEQAKKLSEYENDKYIYFSKPLKEKPLNSWLIVSQINKKLVFLPLEKVKIIFVAVFILGLFLISVFAFYSSEKLVKPIIHISNIMESVVKEKAYSKRVSYKGKDEISILVNSFNFMLSEIEKALKTIEEENRKRVELFKNLIEVFNRITSLQTEKEVLETSVRELKKFLDVKVEFSKEKIGVYSYPIETQKIKGYITFSPDRPVSPEEEKFFSSTVKLVNLLLEKVELLNKAQAASKAKSVFISNMSHELRTPLNSILGFSQYLQTVEQDETKKQALKSIEISGRYLLEIINDILDYAKIEAGAVKVKKEKFNLKDILEEIKSIIKPLSDEKGLQLFFPDIDIELFTDKKLLKQVLLNLLSNAVKFTEKGYIKLSVKKEKDKIFFSVKDTGIGIQKEDIPKLFKNFSQLENPMQKKHKGTGLGLAISKEYVKLLGGEIYVKSEGKYKGTEFTFFIKA